MGDSWALMATQFRFSCRCSVCGYGQDYDPTHENHARIFPEIGYRVDPTGHVISNDKLCPACHLNKNGDHPQAPWNSSMVTDMSPPAGALCTVVTVMDPADIDPSLPANEQAAMRAQIQQDIAYWQQVTGTSGTQV